MMNTMHESSLTGSLLGLLLLAGSLPAQAGDYKLWRDQVAQQSDKVVELTLGTAGPGLNDHRLWRYQVPAQSEAVARYVAATRPQRQSDSANLFWREQVKSPVAEISSSATASR